MRDHIAAIKDKSVIVEKLGQMMTSLPRVRGGSWYPKPKPAEPISPALSVTITDFLDRYVELTNNRSSSLNYRIIANSIVTFIRMHGEERLLVEEVEKILRQWMVAPQHQEANKVLSEEDQFIDDVRKELNRAREKFPGNRIMTVALAEEFGEMCKAILDEPRENVYKEAVQTAVMAGRCVLDGDGSVEFWRKSKGLDPLRPEMAELMTDQEIIDTLEVHANWMEGSWYASEDHSAALQKIIKSLKNKAGIK